MILNALLFLVGMAIIYAAGSALVTGASYTARYLGIRKMVVAMTVVAFGTSAPEFVVSLLSVLMDKKGISLGNVVGSNIANVGLALGIAALLAPLVVSRRNVIVEFPTMMVLSAVFFLFALTENTVNRVEGVVLVASLIAFTLYALVLSRRDMKRARAEPREDDGFDRSHLPKHIFFIVLGLAGLPAGSKLLIDSSVEILSGFGVPEFIIGATMVAVGTSLPEIATTVIGSFKHEEEIATGNIIGSNIFNIGMVAGTVTLVTPLPVDAKTLNYEFPIMLGFGMIMLPLLLRGKGLGKAWGVFAIASYVAFVVFLFFR